jgi:hypothetical protein
MLMNSPRHLRFTIAALAACFALVAAPVWSYTIIMKDGSKLVAKDKYVVRGDKAIIRLESGSETMLPLVEIDIPRTDAANVDNIGTAVVIEGGEAKGLTKSDTGAPRKATLQDLIQSRAGTDEEAEAAPEPVRRQRPEVSTTAATEVVGRAPLRDVALAGTIREFLFGKGVTSVEVLQGGSASRPLLVFPTRSEGQVFKALAASAVTLIHVREKSPGAVESFEIVCRAPDGGNAGRFVMSPAQAQELVAGRIDMPTYFVKNVIF